LNFNPYICLFGFIKDTSLRLSDFNKVTRKMQLDEDDFKPVDIPYLSTEKVGACYYSNICVSVI
jgi:hypothetical protein